MMQLVSKQVWK